MYFSQSGNFNPDEKVSTDSAYYDVEETEGKIFGISKEGLNSVVDRVRNQRKLDAKENQKNIDDLEQLKTSLQNALSKISNLERDVQPLNEKVKQYKALVNSYEQSAIDQHEKIYSKEKEKKNQLLAINKEYQNVLVDMELKQNEGQHQSRQELISKVTENEVLKQQILSLNSKVQEYKRLSTTSEEELLGKRYDNLREELLKVRNILETSENDRLKERQGKLSVLQNMIVLTKQKSELEGELLTVTKKNSGEKEEEQYSRLFEKYEETSRRLKKAHEVAANEKEVLQRKYLEELRQMKADYEKEFRHVKLESRNLKKSFDEILMRREQEADETMSEIETMRDLPEIIETLSKDGICQMDSSGKEILQNLFVEYKKLFERLSLAVERDESEESLKPIMQALKEERKQLKLKLEEASLKANEKDSELKVTELSLKRQIEELLSEKKNAFLEMQQSMDDSEMYKDEIDELKTTLQSVRETLSKKSAELTVTQESLTRTNNEIQTLDAEHGKVKRNLAVKEAEVSRLYQDLKIEQEKYTSESAQTHKLSEDVIEKMKSLSENERAKSMLRDKVSELEQELNAFKQKNNRMSTELSRVNESNAELLQDVMEQKSLCGQHEVLIASLKTQNTSLEDSLKGNIQSSTSSSLQYEIINTELLATRQLLSEEEKKTSERDKHIDELAKEILQQTNSLNQTEQQNDQLKAELQRLKEILAEIEKHDDKDESHHRHQYVLKESADAKESEEERMRNTELEEELRMCNKELDELRTRNKELEEEVRTRNKKLKEEVRTCNKELEEEVRMHNKELEEELRMCNKELDELRTRNKELEDEVRTRNKKLKEEVRTCNKELEEEVRMHNKELEEELRMCNKELEEELRMCNKELDELRTRNTELLDHQNSSSKSQEGAKELEELRTRNKELEELRMRNTELLDDQKRLSKSQEVLNTSLVEEISERKSTQEESAKLKQQLQEQEEIIRQLKAWKVSEVENHKENAIMELKKMISSREEELATLKRENEKIHEEIDHVLKAMQSVDDNGKVVSSASYQEDGVSNAPIQKGVLIRSLDDMLHRIQLKNINGKKKDGLKMRVEEDVTVADTEREVFAANDGFHEDLDWLLANTDGGGGGGDEHKNKKRPVEEQQHVQRQQQQQQLENLENEKTQHWKESLQKDGEIKTLTRTVQQLWDEKKALEEQIKRLEKETIKTNRKKVVVNENFEEELNATQEQLQIEREEKDEAVDCLKVLVVDNEAYGNCIREQKQLIATLKKENKELTLKMNETMEAFDREHEEFLKTKQRLQSVMETTLNRESNVSVQQKHEIERLKLEMENLRNERQQLKIQLEDQRYELNKTNEDYTCLKSSVEYSLGGMDAEKRTKAFVEEQLRLVVQDRGQTLQKLRSTELLNKMLQNKIKELQKWHNHMEMNLLRSRDYQTLPAVKDFRLIEHNSEMSSPKIDDTNLEKV